MNSKVLVAHKALIVPDDVFLWALSVFGVLSSPALAKFGSVRFEIIAEASRRDFVPNHVTGIFFDNKAHYTTWFSAEKHCIHGIQMIPVSPINGLARTASFVQEEWDDILSKEAIVTRVDTTNAWLSLLLVNEAVINQADALAKLETAAMDDGLSRSWALYNAASRGGSTLSGSTTVVTLTPSTATATPDATPTIRTVTTATPVATIATQTVTMNTPIVATAGAKDTTIAATATPTLRRSKFAHKVAVGQS